MSHNATTDPFALGTITPVYYSFDGSSWFYTVPNVEQGMFQFSGVPINTASPEPGSLPMLGSGLLATLGEIRRKLC